MIRACTQCGKEGYIKPARTNQETFFCSMQCKKDWSTLEKRLFASYEVDESTGCWNWTGSLRVGYGVIGDKKKSLGAHRVSYELNKGPIPEGLVVCHSCDNRRCINPEHLWLGTQKDNMQDCARKGRIVTHEGDRFKHGNTPYNSKFSPEIVLEVRRLSKEKMKIRSISEKTGVPEHTVKDIRAGRAYASIR